MYTITWVGGYKSLCTNILIPFFFHKQSASKANINKKHINHRDEILSQKEKNIKNRNKRNQQYC